VRNVVGQCRVPELRGMGGIEERVARQVTWFLVKKRKWRSKRGLLEVDGGGD